MVRAAIVARESQCSTIEKAGFSGNQRLRPGRRLQHLLQHSDYGVPRVSVQRRQHDGHPFPVTVSLGHHLINSSQEVVGEGLLTSSDFHAFLRSGSQMIDLGTLGGSQASAYAVNDSGEIAGTSGMANGDQHAFLYANAALYSNGAWVDLGAVPGAVSTQATGINGLGQIVGTAIFPVRSYHPFRPGKHVGGGF